ncbi:MAG: TolC family protein [Desulfobacterales bacterium]|nr:TolC family protein [Desulfobacterales bacterium]
MKKLVLFQILFLISQSDIVWSFNESDNRLTCNEAVITAKNNNPTVAKAYESLQAAIYRHNQTLSAYHPEISASGNTGVSVNDYFNPKDNFSYRDYLSASYSMSLNLSYQIYDGMKRQANKLYTLRQKEAESELLKDAVRILEHSVCMAYYDAILMREEIRISKTDLNYQNDMIKNSELKRKAGLVDFIDEYNFKTKANIAYAQLKGYEELFKAKLSILASLIGIEAANFSVTPELDPVPLPSDFSAKVENLETCKILAWQNRTDLKALSKQMESLRFKEDSVKAKFYPDVFVKGYIATSGNDYNYTNGPSGIFSNKMEYGLSLLFSYNIWDGNLIKNELLESQSISRKIEQTVKELRNRIAKDVTSAYLEFESAKEKSRILHENISLQHKLTELVRMRFDKGMATITHLNEVLRDLIYAERASVQAVIQLLMAHSALKTEMGLTLEINKQKR